MQRKNNMLYIVCILATSFVALFIGWCFTIRELRKSINENIRLEKENLRLDKNNSWLVDRIDERDEIIQKYEKLIEYRDLDC